MDHTQFSETLIGSGHTQVVLQKRPECFLADKHTCVAILSLVNAALGAGVLAYPFAYMSAGMVLASVFTTAIGFLSMVSLCIIMHSMTVLQQREGMAAIRSFGDMIKYGLGARASNALEALIVVYMFGACVGYLTVLENVFDGVVSDAQLKHLGFTSRHEADVLCICAASVVCFALATLRSIEALKYSAAAAVLAVLFTVGTLVYQAFADPCLPPLANATATQQRMDGSRCVDEMGRHGWTRAVPGVSLWPGEDGFSGVLKALPLICFAVQCQIQCAAAYCEMPPRLARSVTARRKVAYGATALTLLLYFPAGIAGFVRFGDATQSDVLYNFGVRDGFADVARACMALTALSAFPCQHYPARTILHKIWRARCAPPPMPPAVNVHVDLTASRPSGMDPSAVLDAAGGLSCAFAVVEAFLWTLVVLGVTIFATLNDIKLDLIFQLIGSICGSAVILIMPGFLWAALGSGPPRSLGRLLPAAVLIVIGFFIMGAGTYVTVDEMLHPKTNSSSA